MIRTMARVTDVHQIEDEEDGVELPAKIVNEDLRRFFMPKKYAEPEPMPKLMPEAEKVEEKAAEDPAKEEAEATQNAEAVKMPMEEPGKEEVLAGAAPAPPIELLRKSEQHAQSPKSAYAPGAFDPRAPQAPMTSPAKSGSNKWWRLGSMKSRMGKESSTAKVAPTPSVRFLEKHTHSQPSAKQLLDGERPLQPTPGETHAEADPAAFEPATAEVAPAVTEVAPAADKGGLVAEVTPAAVDSTAAAGEPIAEAVVALQEVMEPAPVPEPVLKEDAVREAEPVEATAVAAEENKVYEEPVQALHEAPVEAAVHKRELSTAKEVGAAEATAHKEEAPPVEATIQKKGMSEAEVAAPLDAMTDKVVPETAQPEEPSAQVLPRAPAAGEEAIHEEEVADFYHNAPEEAHEAEPEQAQALAEEPAATEAAAVEEPVTETKAAERKAITMNMTLNEELESTDAEHRPVSCNFVVDEDALPAAQLASIPEPVPMSTQSSPQKEMPINDFYKKGDRKAGKKGRGLFSCFSCFSA